MVRGVAARDDRRHASRRSNENESIYIPLGAVHRLENQGTILLELIEVQTGTYLGEDDIIRLEDDYRRSPSTGSAGRAALAACVRRRVIGRPSH